MEAQLKRHEPLYLKHRPQALDQLVGQSAVTRTLINAINTDRLTHAYLFTGPRGTGKTSSARILAKSLNCKAFEKATATPCQTCDSCVEITKGNSPAVFEIDAASNNSVDDARVLIERAPLVAAGARNKIYIIDECHMLTKEAFNALLKLIEEPPKSVVFILATTEEHKVLPTIVSRCQRLMFRLVTHPEQVEHLKNVARQEEIDITDRALDFIARRSGGGMRDALGLLDQASLLGTPGQPVDINDLLSLLGALNEDVLLEMSDHVLNRRGHDLLACANELLGHGREPAIVVQELARHFLNLAKASYLSEGNQADALKSLIMGSPSYLDGLARLAPQFERSELSQLVEQLDRLESTCRRTTQPAMHLEVGLLALCHRHDMVLVRELSERITRLEQQLASGSISVSARPATLQSAPPTVQANAAPSYNRPQESPPVHSQPAPAARPSPAVAPQPTPAPAPAVATPTAAATAPTYASAPAASIAVTNGESRPAPAPAAPPRATADGGTDGPSGDDASADEVDNVWSMLLDHLQSKHLPTFSLLTAQAFPFAMNAREFTVGVNSETLQGAVERKAEHIKSGIVAVTGKQLTVKVKVQANKQFTAAAPKPAPPPTPVAQAPAPARPREAMAAPVAGGGAPGPDDDEEYDPAPRVKLDENISTAGSAMQPHPPQGATTATLDREAAVKPAPAPADNSGVSAEELLKAGATANNGTIIKEATKLFDGPGSRIIGERSKE